MLSKIKGDGCVLGILRLDAGLAQNLHVQARVVAERVEFHALHVRARDSAVGRVQKRGEAWVERIRVVESYRVACES